MLYTNFYNIYSCALGVGPLGNNDDWRMEPSKEIEKNYWKKRQIKKEKKTCQDSSVIPNNVGIICQIMQYCFISFSWINFGLILSNDIAAVFIQ